MTECLTIITCIIRPAGAIEAARSIQQAHPHDLEIRHILAYWPGAPDPSRVRVVPWLNGLIAEIGDGWLLFIDDDNRLHPELPRRLAELMNEHPAAAAFVFGMACPDTSFGTRQAGPGMLRPGSVDGGQIVVRADLARSVPFEGGDCYDGQWIAALYRQAPGAFVFVGETLTYHNHQVWQKEIDYA